MSDFQGDGAAPRHAGTTIDIITTPDTDDARLAALPEWNDATPVLVMWRAVHALDLALDVIDPR